MIIYLNRSDGVKPRSLCEIALRIAFNLNGLTLLGLGRAGVDGGPVKTLAFLAFSCRIYGYPRTQTAMIAVKETANFLELHEELEKVIFVCLMSQFMPLINKHWTH